MTLSSHETTATVASPFLSPSLSTLRFIAFSRCNRGNRHPSRCRRCAVLSRPATSAGAEVGRAPSHCAVQLARQLLSPRGGEVGDDDHVGARQAAGRRHIGSIWLPLANEHVLHQVGFVLLRLALFVARVHACAQTSTRARTQLHPCPCMRARAYTHTRTHTHTHIVVQLTRRCHCSTRPDSSCCTPTSTRSRDRCFLCLL